MCGNNWKRTLTFSGFNKSTICYHAFNLHVGACVCSTGCPGLWAQSCCTSSVPALTVTQSQLISSRSQSQQSSRSSWEEACRLAGVPVTHWRVDAGVWHAFVTEAWQQSSCRRSVWGHNTQPGGTVVSSSACTQKAWFTSSDCCSNWWSTSSRHRASCHHM